MKLRTKLMLASATPLLIGTLLLYAGVQWSLNNQTETRLRQLREQEEQAVIERMKTAINLAIAQATEAAKQNVPDAEIMRLAGTLKSGSTYLFIQEFNPANPTTVKMLWHATVPALNGQDQTQQHDLNSYKKLYFNGRIYDKTAPEVQHIKGQYFVQEMGRQVAQSGEGIIRYFWHKPKAGGGGMTEEAYLKLAYVKLMPSKNWMFGTGEYADYIDLKVNAAADAARADARRVVLVTIALAAGILVVNVLAVFFYTSRIAAPISNTVKRLRTVSEEVTTTADQLSSFSQSLAEGTTEQASSLEEISATLQELAAKTSENADHAREAKALTDRTQTHASQGTQVMAQMVTVIGGIKDSTDRTAKIVKSIDELAFQTNLLALNAAVEAARAGDSGSGFAVVAEEVRNLAQRSAKAAQETAGLIQESQEKSGLGVSVAGELGKMLSGITTGIGELGVLVSDVAAASSEQASGVGQVSQAIAQIDTVTQRTAANSEETSAAGQELRRQSADVGAIIESLSRVVGEANAA